MRVLSCGARVRFSAAVGAMADRHLLGPCASGVVGFLITIGAERIVIGALFVVMLEGSRSASSSRPHAAPCIITFTILCCPSFMLLLGAPRWPQLQLASATRIIRASSGLR